MGGFAPNRETAKRGFPASPRILRARRKHARRLTRHWRRGIKLVMIILKILRKSEWQALRAEGQSEGAPVDVADGYIHFSTVVQAPDTAAKHFAGVSDLMLIAAESEQLSDALRWEVSRGGQEFPHLYRELRLSDVVWAQPLPLVDGVHQFPAGLE